MKADRECRGYDNVSLHEHITNTRNGAATALQNLLAECVSIGGVKRQIKAMMAEDGDFLRPIVRTVIEEFLEAEMTEAIGAQKGKRVEGRSG